MFTEGQILELVLGYAQDEAKYFKEASAKAVGIGATSGDIQYACAKSEAFQEVTNLINNLKAGTNRLRVS